MNRWGSAKVFDGEDSGKELGSDVVPAFNSKRKHSFLGDLMPEEDNRAINLRNIMKIKQTEIHRSVRVPVTDQGEEVEKWVFSLKSAERRTVHITELAEELADYKLAHKPLSKTTDKRSTTNDVAMGASLPSSAEARPSVVIPDQSPRPNGVAKPFNPSHHHEDSLNALLKDIGGCDTQPPEAISQVGNQTLEANNFVSHQLIPEEAHRNNLFASQGHNTSIHSSYARAQNSTSPSILSNDETNRSVVWYHVYGSNKEALQLMAKSFHIRPQDVHAACSPAMDGPEVHFVTGAKPEWDYLFTVCHELRLSNADDAEGNNIPISPMVSSPASKLKSSLDGQPKNTTKKAFPKKKRDAIWAAARELELEEVQVCFFFFPDQQALITVGLSSMHSPVLEAARKNLVNFRSALRQDCAQKSGAVTLMVVMLDALMDTLLPTLDLYGDVLEGVSLLMHSQPSQTFVRLADKLRTRLQQIRRYTWDTRGIFLELQQDMHGVMLLGTLRFQTLMNSSNQIEKETEAYLTICNWIETFYHAFQQSQMNSTLYTLTTATISIMPMQLLTGIWGMNFENMPELHWEYGYVMFWILAGIVFCFAVFWISRAHVVASRGAVILHN